MGAGGGGTPEPPLLSVEQGRTRDESCKWGSGNSSVWKVSFCAWPRFIDFTTMPIQWFIGPANIIFGRIALKCTAILGGY